MQNEITLTTKRVVDNSKFVTIDKTQIEQICKYISDEELMGTSLNLFSHRWDKEEAVWIIFLFNCVNFCYWPEKGQNKWGFELGNDTYYGSIGLFKAIEQAVKTGLINLNIKSISRIGGILFDSIIGENKNIPMKRERQENILTACTILEDKYSGSPVNIVLKADESAVKLADELSNNFSFLRDGEIYDNSKIWFLKRAQLMSKMLKDYFNSQGMGIFHDMDKLTVFADYRVPQILNTLGILRYTKSLEKILVAEEEIPNGSPIEVEIRSSTIQVGEIIKKVLKDRLPTISSADIDTFLWTKSKTVENRLPHHRTKSIFY